MLRDKILPHEIGGQYKSYRVSQQFTKSPHLYRCAKNLCLLFTSSYNVCCCKANYFLGKRVFKLPNEVLRLIRIGAIHFKLSGRRSARIVREIGCCH